MYNKPKTLTMNKITIYTALLLLAASCGNQGNDLNKEISVPVSVMDISPRSIERFIETTGNVFPVKEASIKSEVAGYYQLNINPATGRKYALGDAVSEGQEIVTLADREYENNIKITSLELKLEISKQVYDKQQSLYEKGGVTLSELKNAEIEFINSKYAYEDALIRLAKLHIKAPISGVIVELPYFTPGTRCETGAQMFKIMDYSKLYMDISLPEKDYQMVKPGQPVKITNYTLPDDTLKGIIAQISPAIDATTRSFKSVIAIDNQKSLLRPGMFAKGEIVIARADSAIVVPKNVILSKQRGNTVFVVEKDLAQEKVVTFGLENAEEVQIVSGLEKGDRLVVKGFETLRNRSKVKVVK